MVSIFFPLFTNNIFINVCKEWSFLKNLRNLNIKGTVLDKFQLENYMEKMASDHILQNSSSKDTYPIPRMKENFEIFEVVYNLLNEHI